MDQLAIRVCSELSSLPGSAVSVGTGGHLAPGSEGVCGDGVVVDRASDARGDQRREMALALPPGCLLVTMVARATLRGSGASLGVVSNGCSRGVAGGLEVAQPLGRGPRSSLVSWH